jgi:hypothetical protein
MGNSSILSIAMFLIARGMVCFWVFVPIVIS